MARPRHERQIPRGGNDSAPQRAQRSTTRRPCLAASQNGSVSSVTAGGMPVVASIVPLSWLSLADGARAEQRADLGAAETPLEQNLRRVLPGRGRELRERGGCPAEPGGRSRLQHTADLNERLTLDVMRMGGRLGE